MLEDRQLIQWFAERYEVDGEIAYDLIHFGPGWWVLLALLEAVLYEKTNGQMKRPRFYLPGYPDFEKVGLTSSEASRINQNLMALLPLIVKAAKGDKDSKVRIAAIRKIADIHSFKTALPDIEKFLKTLGADASRARAFRIRKYMELISLSVTPKWTDSTTVSEGTVRLLPPKVIRGPFVKDLERIIKKNSTLQSLAVTLYKEELARSGISISERQLRLDIEEFKNWKPKKGEPVIPLFINTYDKKGIRINHEEILVGFSSDEWRNESSDKRYKAAMRKLGTRKKN